MPPTPTSIRGRLQSGRKPRRSESRSQTAPMIGTRVPLVPDQQDESEKRPFATLIFLWVSWNNVEKNIAEFWGELFLPLYPITQSASLRPQRSSRKLIWLRKQLMFSNSCHVFGRERCWWMGDVGVSTAISRWLLNEKLGGESNGVDCQCIFEQQLLKKRTLRVLHFILSRFRFLCDKDALFNVISGFRTEDIVYITL